MLRKVYVALVGLAFLGMAGTAAQAALVNIQPIQICDDGGANCAETGFFEAETDKIWAQAGIDINFESIVQINETDWLDVDYVSGDPLPQEPQDIMEYAETNINDSDVTLSINMFFVDTMPGLFGLGCGAPLYAGFCEGYVGIFITGGVYSYNSDIGRLDTIAHEIGHVLGLEHDGGATNLMESGGSRTVPDDISNIAPDGDNLSQLSADQITEVYNSKFVQVPEPPMLALFAIGLVFVFAARRRWA